MFCQSYNRAFVLMAALITSGFIGASAQVPNGSAGQIKPTTVHLRWAKRPGVSRYRLQVALDRKFTDIVFDRLVTTEETAIDDLSPGRYFWRIAPVTTKLGEFSSPIPFEVAPEVTAPVQPRVEQITKDIVAGGGWRAAVGDISRPVLAHLRAPDQFDIVGTNNEGVTFALDAITGVASWSMRPRPQSNLR